MATKPTLKQLEAFVEVARTGGFSKAAEQLATTQPNISTRVAALEALVGSPLIDRQSDPLTLTAMGQDLLVYAKGALDQATRFAEASGRGDLLPVKLRLGVTELAVEVILPRFAAAFNAAYPDQVLEPVVGLSADLEHDLAAGKLDLAICNAPFTFPHLSAAGVGTFDWSLVGQGDGPIYTGSRTTSAYRALVAQGVQAVPASTLRAALAMVQSGAGRAVLPSALVENGALCPWDVPPLSFSILHDPSRPGAWFETVSRLIAKGDGKDKKNNFSL